MKTAVMANLNVATHAVVHGQANASGDWGAMSEALLGLQRAEMMTMLGAMNIQLSGVERQRANRMDLLAKIRTHYGC